MAEKKVDFSRIKTSTAAGRKNLVHLGNLMQPGRDQVAPVVNPEFDELVERIRAARNAGAPILWSIGAHVVKCGLSRYLIEFMKAGYLTHLAGNGASSIHDFELACLGGTSEDVPTAIEDGSFGMWEETGRWMNEAIQAGWKRGLGYGRSLAAFVDEHPERFPNREICLFYQAARLGLPATYHIALGTDIIHQHPIVDFSAIGGASGIDFHEYCETVARLENGVFLNFGSAVIGPEVFLKALSIARNLGFQVKKFTTANFDLIDLGDYRSKVADDVYHYYYRPRKNIVNRPVSMGGKGFHFNLDHRVSIPGLYQRLLAG